VRAAIAKLVHLMRDEFDAIVVGAGLMGTATAWSLARRGRSVLMVEQFGAGHGRGSSHGSARIVRRAYGDALYTRLTGESFELWRELERQSGASILRTLGGLDYGARHDVDGISRRLRTEKVPYELLRAEDAQERWPGMRFKGDVLFHPQAGTMDAALAIQTFTAEAARLGAEVRYETRVHAVLTGDDRAEIELVSGERLAANSVVVAAGAWVGNLLDGLVALPRIEVTQQQIFHFPRMDTQAEAWPSVIHDELTPVYHLAGGRDGGPGDDRKVAEHRHGTPTTAAGRSGMVDPASRARLVEYVTRWLPGLDPTPRREATCLYTTTQSEDFILDRVGALVICSPCSGHGAKFAPLIGEMTADLVTSPAAPRIPERFRIASAIGVPAAPTAPRLGGA
jgi:monomeric sarcosine oxidase